MKISLIRAAMGSLLLGGFLHSFAQEFIQYLGNSTVVAEQSTETILDGLREDEVLKTEKLDRKISTTIAETIKNEPDIAFRSMGPAAARPVIKGLSGSHVVITEDGSFCGDMSATSPDHAVASEVLTAHKLRITRGPQILTQSFATAGGVIQVEHNDITFEIARSQGAPTQSAAVSNTQIHGYIADYAESSQPGFATVVGVNGNIHRLSLKGELSARNMGDMKTPKGSLKNTEIENKSIAVGAAYTYERGNHKLDAESGYGAELEFRNYGEVINWRAAVHSTWFLNYLAPRATGDTNWSQILPIYQVSGDDALLMGASASVETVTETGFYAQAGASYVCGFYQNENWSDMPQIPPFKFHGEIVYLWTHVRAGINTEFALAQNRLDRYEERTPGYATFGVSLEFHWPLTLAHYSIVLRGDNLFNADVRNHLSRLKSVMPEKGRNVSILAKAEF